MSFFGLVGVLLKSSGGARDGVHTVSLSFFVPALGEGAAAREGTTSRHAMCEVLY